MKVLDLPASVALDVLEKDSLKHFVFCFSDSRNESNNRFVIFVFHISNEIFVLIFFNDPVKHIYFFEARSRFSNDYKNLDRYRKGFVMLIQMFKSISSIFRTSRKKTKKQNFVKFFSWFGHFFWWFDATNVSKHAVSILCDTCCVYIC